MGVCLNLRCLERDRDEHPPRVEVKVSDNPRRDAREINWILKCNCRIYSRERASSMEEEIWALKKERWVLKEERWASDGFGSRRDGIQG